MENLNKYTTLEHKSYHQRKVLGVMVWNMVSFPETAYIQEKVLTTLLTTGLRRAHDRKEFIVD